MSEMGSVQPVRQPVREGQPIVAFDFDGTLTVGDSFTHFLRWRAGLAGWTKGMVRMVPDVARYVVDRDRGRIKAASVRVFLGGVDRQTLEQEATAFADAVWDDFLRPDALACWNDWGHQGAHRVIVTASPAVTVVPFAQRLGAEGLIGTKMAFDHQNRVTGAFAGPNCRGGEKVRRLKSVYGEAVKIAAAYGDTSGDTEMLAMTAEPGFRVFTGRP